MLSGTDYGLSKAKTLRIREYLDVTDAPSELFSMSTKILLK
jgi:hypothetical protein